MQIFPFLLMYHVRAKGFYYCSTASSEKFFHINVQLVLRGILKLIENQIKWIVNRESNQAIVNRIRCILEIRIDTQP